MSELKLEWRLLTLRELERVYLDEMRRDFPPAELKPLSMILNSNASGAAHSWGVFDGETLAAYMLMVRPEGGKISQLDYFAVVPAYRAAGLGARLLGELLDREAGAELIIIEAESPEFAPDKAMAERRLGFYKRCGCVDTGCTEVLVGVYFNALTLSRGRAEPMSKAEAARAIEEFYLSTAGEEWSKKNLKLIC